MNNEVIRVKLDGEPVITMYRTGDEHIVPRDKCIAYDGGVPTSRLDLKTIIKIGLENICPGTFSYEVPVTDDNVPVFDDDISPADDDISPTNYDIYRIVEVESKATLKKTTLKKKVVLPIEAALTEAILKKEVVLLTEVALKVIKERPPRKLVF